MGLGWYAHSHMRESWNHFLHPWGWLIADHHAAAVTAIAASAGAVAACVGAGGAIAAGVFAARASRTSVLQLEDVSDQARSAALQMEMQRGADGVGARTGGAGARAGQGRGATDGDRAWPGVAVQPTLVLTTVVKAGTQYFALQNVGRGPAESVTFEYCNAHDLENTMHRGRIQGLSRAIPTNLIAAGGQQILRDLAPEYMHNALMVSGTHRWMGGCSFRR